MRNTGSHISNNTYHSNEIRGGEKKVMKKSLSVILSTTMALSAFSTAALAATSSSDFSDLKDLSAADKAIFDKLIKDEIFLGQGDKFGINEHMTRSQFAVAIVKAFGLTADATTSSFSDVKSDAPELRFIEAAYKNGIANGHPNGTFDPKGEVSREELAIFLVGALGPKYKEEARAAQGNDPTVSDWAYAQGYVATALKYKLMENVSEGKFDGKEAATRYQLAKGVAAAQAKYAEDHKPPYATKVESVKATNLAQVFVTFDGEVEKASAEEVDNYALNDNKNIRSATLSEDGRMVTLELDTPDSVFVNQKEYKLTVSNVKAGDNVVNTTDYKFTPLDVEIPAVSSITPLGNSAIKIKFSEPIKAANTTSFKIDGNVVVGSTDIISDTVILKVYSKLSDGDHKITVKGVSDFNNLLSLESEHEFTVVADTTPPEVKEVVNATFERITLKFSKPVDKATVLANSVYWLQGSTKRHANSVKQISDDTFEFDFSNYPIRYTTDLYVTGVRDYSGNTVVADYKVQVNPVIDQTRPEITIAKYDADLPGFVIKFNKSLDRDSATKTANFVIKNNKGEEVYKYKTVTLDGDQRTVNVKILEKLKAGSYTIEINGVMDNTTLKNSILPFSKTIEVGDTEAPTVVDRKVYSNSATNQLFVNFDKVMAVSGEGSVVQEARYMYQPKNDLNAWKSLPEGTQIGVSADGKTAIIQIPTPQYNNKSISVSEINQLRVMLVQGVNGKHINPLTDDYPVSEHTKVNFTEAKAVAKDKIELSFDQPLLANTFSRSDFRVEASNGQGLNVVDGIVDGKKITLVLSSSDELKENGRYGSNDLPVYVTAGGDNTRTSTVSGAKINYQTQEVKAKIAVGISSLNGKYNGTTIFVKFNGNIDQAATPAQAASDFVIKQEFGDKKTLQDGIDFEVEPLDGGDTVIIKLINNNGTGLYSLGIVPRFLKSNGVLVAAVDAGSRLVNVESTGVPTLGGVTVANVTGPGNDDKVKVSVPSLPAGSTNSYQFAVSPTSHTAPVAGSRPGWAPLPSDGVISAPAGQYIAVVEVNGSGVVQKFTQVVSNAQAHVPGTSGTLTGSIVVTDDAALEALTTTEDTKRLIITIDGDINNTFVYVVDASVTTKAGFEAALTAALGGKATAAFDATSNKLVVRSASVGANSQVSVGGDAAAAFFGTPSAVKGTDPKN